MDFKMFVDTECYKNPSTEKKIGKKYLPGNMETFISFFFRLFQTRADLFPWE